jgi:hypothetical protein
MANKALTTANVSGFKGVTFTPTNRKWRVRFRANHVQMHGGYFSTAIEAARAYNALATRHLGEFAWLNQGV